MPLSAPSTKTTHQHVVDCPNIGGLNALSTSEVQWEWGRIASKFRDDHNYDFAQGAYSSIDKPLEIAMSESTDASGKIAEHEYFKTVLKVDVHPLKLDGDKNVNGVNVRTEAGQIMRIPAKAGDTVVLCTGSVFAYDPCASGIGQQLL